ncbi:cAMP-specific 3',5'-cyclic phosphodiesterase 4D [Cladochytrium tenue]|nr:cAMP-specific 3',5'-cyclic phosphodiesterase 4D [Cladochytrium tenue]
MSLLEKVDQWNWSIFELDHLSNSRPLFTLCNFLCLKAGLYSKLQIPTEAFSAFLTEIENGYHRDVPYHNAIHAADVLHGVNFLQTACQDEMKPSDLELLSLYIAASIHDLEYPGKTNNFLVNAADPRAIMYNDRSVLENHHLATAFRVLSRSDCNFMAHFSRDHFKQVREMVIDMVLATDVQSHHFAVLSTFKNKVQFLLL